MKFSKNVNNEKCAPNIHIFRERIIEWIEWILDVEIWLGKLEFCNLLRTRSSSKVDCIKKILAQNLLIYIYISSLCSATTLDILITMSQYANLRKLFNFWTHLKDHHGMKVHAKYPNSYINPPLQIMLVCEDFQATSLDRMGCIEIAKKISIYIFFTF